MNQNDINQIYALTQAKILPFPQAWPTSLKLFGDFFKTPDWPILENSYPQLKFGGYNNEYIQVTKGFINEGHTNNA